MTPPHHPCPFCGKETKVMHDPASRICSVCRKVSSAFDCTAQNAPKPKPKKGTDDVVHMSEEVKAGIERDPTAPHHPCLICGKETKVGHAGERVCRQHMN